MITKQKEKVFEILSEKYSNRTRSEVIVMINKKLGTTEEILAGIYNEWRK